MCSKASPPTDGEKPLFERHFVLIVKQLQRSRFLSVKVMNLYPALFHPKQTFRQQGDQHVGEILSEREQEAAGAEDDSACKFGPKAHFNSQEKDATDSREILAIEITVPRNHRLGVTLRYKDHRKKEIMKE